MPLSRLVLATRYFSKYFGIYRTAAEKERYFRFPADTFSCGQRNLWFFFILFMSDSLSLNAVIMADCRRLRRRVWQTKRRPFKVVFSSLNAFAISCISSQSSLSLQTAPSLKKLGLIWHPRNLNGLSPVDIMSGEKPSSMRRFLSSSDSENPIVKTRVLSELIKRPEKNNQNPEKSSSQ